MEHHQGWRILSFWLDDGDIDLEIYDIDEVNGDKFALDLSKRNPGKLPNIWLIEQKVTHAFLLSFAR